MNRSTFLRKVIVTVFFLAFICTTICKAGIEPYLNSIKGKIKSGDKVIAQDTKFADPLYNWSDVFRSSVYNSVKLKIVDEKPISKDFSVTVVVRISFYSARGQQDPAIFNKSLTVNYMKGEGAVYQAIATVDGETDVAFKNAYRVEAEVISVTSAEYASADLPDLELEVKGVIDRQYIFKPGASLGLDPGIPREEVARQLNLTWLAISGAEEYDLEWTTIDAGSEFNPTLVTMQNGTEVPDDQMNELFRNNATRINTENNTYKLSLLYNSEYVAIRIRQVQYTEDGIRKEGDWNYKFKDNTYAYLRVNWYEQDKNWQYSATFAEEGKRKEQVSYFDGSLRNRQNVAINTTDNVAVVQETIYDEFGRQAASILPAPIKAAPSLDYQKSLNLNAAGKPYNFTNLKSGGLAPDPLSTSAGTSQYYSPANPFRDDKLFNQYIPDAEGYPFSVQRYTPDNTGRVRVQGGVGLAFQPGITAFNKTTKYYYGKPEQWELDRIFGNDVGYANHYLKNMVIDPNGQISVSYLNASGKTIATALTGSAPESQSALSSLPLKKFINTHLLRPEQFVFNNTELKLSAKTVYTASLPGPATFKYSIEKLVRSAAGALNPICDHCFYKLDIMINNDQNTTVYNSSSDVALDINIPDTDSTSYNKNFDVSLPEIGEYYISVDMTMSRAVIDNSTTSYITTGQTAGTIKDEPQIDIDYLKNTDYAGAFNDCKTCNARLGTPAAFAAAMTGKLNERGINLDGISNKPDYLIWINQLYTDLKQHCIAIQDSCMSPCEKYEMPMKDDVSPGGQYAYFTEKGEPLEKDLNVIYKYWRTEFPESQPGSATYVAELITLKDSTTMSISSPLFTLAMFVNYWKPEWAEKFLKYHPEYCKLDFCHKNSISYNWDDTISDEILFTADIASIPGLGGQYVRSNSAWLLLADPFFQTGAAGATFYAAMQDDLLQYSLKILGRSTGTVKGLTNFVDYILYCADPASNAAGTSNEWDNCTPLEACRVPDREWAMYKSAYLEAKEKYYKQARDLSCACSNCAIGEPYELTAKPGAGIMDFMVDLYLDTDIQPCARDYRNIKVTYMTGAINATTTVELYYPDQTIATSLIFNPGESMKVVCLPSLVPLNSIKVITVTP